MPLGIPPNIIVEDEEVLLGAIRILDFKGVGVTVTVSGNRAAVTISSGGGGGGDMVKSTYDVDNDGVVDNSAKLGGHTYEDLVGSPNLDGGRADTIYGGTLPIDGGDST